MILRITLENEKGEEAVWMERKIQVSEKTPFIAGEIISDMIDSLELN